MVCGISTVAIIGSIIHDSLFDSIVIFLGNEILFNVSTLLWNTIVLAGAWWFGNTVRIRREQTLQLQERTEQLAREREENARRAVLDERVRIARELHDVVAHHVSLMGIHAGAAREVLKKQPERALNSLNLIETSSRQAVAELYRLLGLLRDEKQVEKFTSQPGLNQLDELVAEMQKAGLPVEVKIEGEKHEIPQSVDLSAYRIAEEALTNTLKHAGPAKATVTIGYRDDALYLEILDSGHGALFTNGKQIKGKGLIGMRERVNLLNGEFWAGNAPNSGFCVRAKLPLA
ncbi:Sensor histidine kinase LiaS [subsurface metagenome]